MRDSLQYIFLKNCTVLIFEKNRIKRNKEEKEVFKKTEVLNWNWTEPNTDYSNYNLIKYSFQIRKSYNKHMVINIIQNEEMWIQCYSVIQLYNMTYSSYSCKLREGPASRQIKENTFLYTEWAEWGTASLLSWKQISGFL